jgi:hypothetical protein
MLQDVPHCAALCCLYCGMPHFAALCCILPPSAALCCTSLHYAEPCHAIPQYSILDSHCHPIEILLLLVSYNYITIYIINPHPYICCCTQLTSGPVKWQARSGELSKTLHCSCPVNCHKHYSVVPLCEH